MSVTRAELDLIGRRVPRNRAISDSPRATITGKNRMLFYGSKYVIKIRIMMVMAATAIASKGILAVESCPFIYF